MRRTTIAYLALAMLAVYAIVSLVSVRRDLADAMEQTMALKAEIEQAQEESLSLEGKILALNTDEGAAQLARQRLRLAGADETIFADR